VVLLETGEVVSRGSWRKHDLFWIAIGIAIGVGYGGFVSAQTRPAGAPRLVVTPATATDRQIRRAVFVKDSQTGSCWLAQGDGSDLVFSALAPAPTAACQ
jgi:hypothetical protein